MNKKNDIIGIYSEEIMNMLERSENEKFAGNHEKAISIAQEVLGKDPECIPALEEIADNFLTLGDIKRAEKTVLFLLSLTVESYTGNYIYGFILSKKLKFKESVKALSVANEQKPNNSEILRCLGWSLFMAGEKSKGIITLERALNISGDDITTLSDLAICYIDTGFFDKTKEIINKCKKINPNDPRIEKVEMILEKYLKGEFK